MYHQRSQKLQLIIVAIHINQSQSHCHFYVFATVRTDPESFHTQVCPPVSECASWKPLNTISQKLMKGISPNFHHRCIGSQMCWMDFGPNGQRSRSQQAMTRNLVKSQKPMKGISPNFVHRRIWVHMCWLDFRVKGHRDSMQRRNSRWQPVEFCLVFVIFSSKLILQQSTAICAVSATHYTFMFCFEVVKHRLETKK